MKTIRKYVNRYRTLQTDLFNFPKEIDPHGIKFVGYLKHDGISKMKGLSIFSFQSVSYLRTTSKGLIHCIGLRDDKCIPIIFEQTV